jgi:hypothetical protein
MNVTQKEIDEGKVCVDGKNAVSSRHIPGDK